MGDLVFGTEACHLFNGEVHFVVRDDRMREPKATYNVLSKKFDCCLMTSKMGTAFTHLVK